MQPCKKREPCNHANHAKTSKGDLGCVLMGQVYLKAILKKKKQEKPKSKLGLPRVTIRDQIISQPKSLR